MSDQKFRDPEEAARFLTDVCGVPTAKSTLAKLRTVGGGPVFQKFGKHVRYSEARLREYAARRISPERCSTSVAA